MFSKGKKEMDTGVGTAVPAKPAAPSIISTDMKIVGDIVSEGEIQVDGTVEGDICSKTLLIGEPANITGEVVADVVHVFGTIHGQIKGVAVSLAKTAHVVGDILHDNLSIEKGAFLEGHCKRMPPKKEGTERISLVRENGTDPGKKDEGSVTTPAGAPALGGDADKRVKTPS
jgi:cytoskeletal protein CcmA (bactofilin family)